MHTAASLPAGFRRRPAWLLALAAVTVGQLGLADQLLGGWESVTDDRPIVAGRHPLHLYHAGLGSATFARRQTAACYDPNFQAGYPKTPVFDGGSRPAEVALYLAGGGYRPAAYKIGLLVLCVSVPGVFALAARGAGLCARSACLAAALGCLLWWSPPVRGLLDAGDVDLLLAGLPAVVFVAWLARYHADPGPLAWVVLSACATIGWYAHPVLWLGLGPVVGVYYLMVAPRHGPGWHLGLVGVTLAGVGPNLWWLWDWGKFWWLRQPSVDDVAPLPTWGAALDTWTGNAGLLGPAPLGWPLVLLGVGGLFVMHRPAAGLLAVTGLFAFVVARLGQTWPPLANGGADRAAPFVAALAVLPTARLLAGWGRADGRFSLAGLVTVAVVAAPVGLGWGAATFAPLAHRLNVHADPLPLGLTDDQQTLVDALRTRTTADARILLEDGPTTAPGWNWTALLPELTGRAYLGGLDPDARLEHAYCGLAHGRLNGRPLGDWSDAELAAFARRYNVGWVLCRTPATAERWTRTGWAKEVGRYQDNGEVVLLELNRPRSFVLLGSARVEHADGTRIVLADVTPAPFPHPNGEPTGDKVIVLSLHHQAGLRVTPSVARIDRDPDPFDPIPMLRLRLNGPASRLVISWENP